MKLGKSQRVVRGEVVPAALTMWVVHESPADYPGRFVAREWRSDRGGTTATNRVVVDDTLEKVRGRLPPGLVCLSRADADDPVIVETWL